MKKILQLIGVISLMCFSFFYTEKTVNVVKEYDDVMQEIKQASKSYYKESEDAIIVNNTIIPGVSGMKIDEDLSYSKMKRYGKYTESLLAYKTIRPTLSLENNKDKYIISGNKTKNKVSLIFLINGNSDVDPIIKILNQKNITADFFVDGNWVEKNIDTLKYLVEKNHNIGNISYNFDYNDSSFVWLDGVIKKLEKKNYGYCYLEEKNEDVLKLCSIKKNYTIIPNIIIKMNSLQEIKNKLTAGSLISISVNSTTINDLPIIINYILSKGYNIETLDKHLSE